MMVGALFRLNDKVTDYIPEFQDGKSDITIRNLMTHFSGLQPDVAYTYKRNPDWFDKPRPYLDGLRVAIIPSAAQQLAQFTAGNLDQAPVEVSITEQSVSDALAVPVNALVALAGAGYAVEEVEANGTHRLVPVTPGLFDDTQGLVQVAGSGLAVGQLVVVPAS